MKISPLKISIFAALASVFHLSLASASPDIDWSEAIEKSELAIETLLEEKGYPGLSVSVGHKGKIVWSQGFGYGDVENEIPVDPASSLFRIGSVSKPFTATAIGLLVEQGKLDLDETIQTYVPDFPEKEWPITVRQTAGHLAGIRHYAGFEMFNQKHFSTVREGLKIFEASELLHEPGSKYKYSSYGWNLISAVIEGASGEEFLQYMDTKVFKPMDMTKTLADDNMKEIEGRVKFYNMQGNTPIEAPMVDNSYKWAGGGFLSTTDDMIRFGFAHIYGKIMSKGTIDLLWTTMKTNRGEPTNYGLGWFTRHNKKGELIVGHNGGSIGGSTYFKVYPEHEIVVAITTNTSRAQLNGVVGKVDRHFFNAMKPKEEPAP